MMDVKRMIQDATTHAVKAGIGLDEVIITFLRGQVVLSHP